MERDDNDQKYINLRKKYKKFTYESYRITLLSGILEIEYSFNIDEKYFFKPVLKIPIKDFVDTNILSGKGFENIVFHIGMIELISYWKLSCAPIIIVKPFILNEDQKNWWKKIYYYGLGEFFYLNSIDASIDDFVKISCDSVNKLEKGNFIVHDKALIPIGGGKDSALTLELLSKLLKDNLCFIVNPRKASCDTAYTAGYKDENIFVVQRTLDPLMLKLNEEGFLNGHTPFSALLAFTSVLAAILSGRKYIALSNESSANESTVSDTKINHQYSKSIEFEDDFRQYLKAYITESINYFSFLRPLSELQIGLLFSKLQKYHSVFRSCNVGSKTDSWCCSCSKCLFTYIILSPFLSKPEMVSIFGKDLLNNSDLMYEFKQLIGIAETKPFECVGTVDEVKIALHLTILKSSGTKLPYLLEYFQSLHEYNSDVKSFKNNELNTISTTHFLEKRFFEFIKKTLDETAN